MQQVLHAVLRHKSAPAYLEFSDQSKSVRSRIERDLVHLACHRTDSVNCEWKLDTGVFVFDAMIRVSVG